jgi:hypothetical protein
MEKHMDLSHLDKKYFLDNARYNCPFCNRGSVTYEVVDYCEFYWTVNKAAYCYIVQCQETRCKKRSLHMSSFHWEQQQYASRFSKQPNNWDETKGKYNVHELDSYFFFHQPTTFFTLDSRIKRELRDLIAEAEGCLKMNYLVGASACMRKSIYVLIDVEDVRALSEAGKTLYQESIMALKGKFSWVHPEYFDALANIQELASDNVHEGSWKAWDALKIRMLLELTKNILHEMYVVPDEQKNRANVARSLLSIYKSEKNAVSETAAAAKTA